MQAKWELDFERRAFDVLQKTIDRMPKPVDGKDGTSVTADDVLPELVKKFEETVAAIPKPVDGKDGKDGERGNFADFYKGVWSQGEFKRGDTVTWGGSLWMATKDNSAKPEMDDSWVLIVKRGRDGKDGLNGRDVTKPVSAK
jgi:hypothetical protein